MIELIAKQRKPVVVSTGMANLSEIKEILKILKKNQVVLLHCISSYPTHEKDLNLNSFLNLKKFNKTLGFSDHTKDNLGAIMLYLMAQWYLKNIFYQILRLRMWVIINFLSILMR